MPKVQYTAGKGLYQESGSGIDLTGAAATGSLTYLRNIISVTSANRTLLAAESGSLIMLSGAANTPAITLPAVSAGIHYDIILTDTTTQCTIVTASSANVMKGFVIEAEDAGDAASSHAAGDTITLTTGCVAGDRVSLHCDGTNWFVLGLCEVADAMTVTQAA